MGGFGSGRPKKQKYINELQRLNIKQWKNQRMDDSRVTLFLRGWGQYTVFLEQRPCSYGGKRFYFLCPDCHKPVLHLYFYRGGLQCRSCVKMPYESQSLSKGDRLLARYHYYRRKVSLSPDPIFRFPDRPKGMHLNTYLTLREKAYEALRVRQPFSERWMEQAQKSLAKRKILIP